MPKTKLEKGLNGSAIVSSLVGSAGGRWMMACHIADTRESERMAVARALFKDSGFVKNPLEAALGLIGVETDRSERDLVFDSLFDAAMGGDKQALQSAVDKIESMRSKSQGASPMT